MKVSELMDKLKEFPPDAEIKIEIHGMDGFPSLGTIEEVKLIGPSELFLGQSGLYHSGGIE